MKEYIDQIFYEGLGKSIYLPIENKISNIKSNKLKKSLIVITKIIYFSLAIMIALILLYIKF